MHWQSTIIKHLEWSDTISNKEAKQKVAKQIAKMVKDGDVIGVGSGSTSFMALMAIAEKIKAEKLNVKAIPTSIEIGMFCSKLGVPLTSLTEYRPDWYFDGADEVDPNKSLIKGRGGAMFKEKLLMSCSPVNYIIVDDSKLVEKLGSKFPVPIEVFPAALLHVEKQLKALGATELALRPAKGKDGPIITESGNLVLDARFDNIGSDMEQMIKAITGVIESGLFINYNVEIIVA
ncbi:MAG: ribose 5-phosphate isomerase A [Sphingobacteriaceae bacterium]|nr:MAG: ribose 5-phosphate isomerase A [Sphingobacteriaceae bacterium]